PMARGLAMGTAAHALGTTAAIEHGGSRYGAWASLGLTLNGLFTALLTPTLLALMGY
ncbi:MAG: LrgB family protein, partial [Paramuribaculum sp.]|nr:LrgB family protein [Paramuribaculum sp.]